MELLERLEAVELNLKEFLTDNFDFRLDAEYFLKEYLSKLEMLKKVGYKKISDFCYVTDGIHTSIDYCTNSNINLFSATTPRENFFDLSRQVFISEKAQLANPRTALKVNDVIISTVGTIGNCAVVNKSVLPANSDRHVGIIRIEKDFYPRYISTFLLSKFGRFQTWRESTGNVQLNLFLYRIRTLKIANLSLPFQEVIENLVLLNDLKREESKTAYSKAETILLQEIGLDREVIGLNPVEVTEQAVEGSNPSIFTNNGANKNVNVKSFKDSFGVTGRLDAEYYQKKYENFEKSILENNNGFTYIKSEFEHIKTNSKKVESGYNYIEIGDVNVNDGSCKSNYVERVDLPANAKNLVEKGDILISNVRPYRGAITLIDFDQENLIVSGAFTVLREKRNSQFSNEVLKVLLRTSMYKEWLLKFNVGTSYPVIKDEDVLELPIPIISKQTQKIITNKIQQSQILKKQSEHLLEVAKRAVEIAIEKNEELAMAYINENVKS